MPAPTIPELRALAQGVYAWVGVGGDSNAGAIETPDGLIVIDAQQHEGLANQFKAALQARTGMPVRALINTHSHFDHVTGNVVFAGGVPILAHERTLQKLRERLGAGGPEGWSVTNLATKIDMFYGGNTRDLIAGDEAASRWFADRFAPKDYATLRIRPPNQTFADRFTFVLQRDTVELDYFGPAHSDGDIIVVLPRAKIAFLSDLLFYGRFPWLGDCDLNGWIAMLDRVLKMDLTIVVPGHGAPATLKEVEWFRTLLVRVRDLVSEAIRKGLSEDAAAMELALPEYAGVPRYQEWLRFNIRSAYRYMRND